MLRTDICLNYENLQSMNGLGDNDKNILLETAN